MTAVAPTLTRTPPRTATASQRSSQERPDYVSIYVSSILAVSLVFLIGVGLPIAIYMNDFTAGFGLGAFCAIWGGPSFGVMTGAARVSAWSEAQEQSH